MRTLLISLSLLLNGCGHSIMSYHSSVDSEIGTYYSLLDTGAGISAIRIKNEVLANEVIINGKHFDIKRYANISGVNSVRTLPIIRMEVNLNGCNASDEFAVSGYKRVGSALLISREILKKCKIIVSPDL